MADYSDSSSTRSSSRKVRNVLAGLLFFLICMVFVFVGVAPDTGNMGRPGTAAVVEGTVISEAAVLELENRLESQSGGNTQGLNAEQRKQRAEMIRARAVDMLIEGEIGYLAAKKSGVIVTNESIKQEIVNADALKRNGRFSRELYDMYLQSIRSTPGAFEARIGRDLANQQLQKLFLEALKAPQVTKAYDGVLRESRVEVEFAKIDKMALGQPAAAEIANFAADTSKSAEIEAYYKGRIADYKKPETARVRHILVSGDSPESEKKAKAHLARLTKNEIEFATLAKEVSEDPGSKEKGGDLGFILRGQMVKEFEDAAFALKAGEMSSVVKSSFGYHIIKTEEKKAETTETLESVRNKIAETLLRDGRMAELLKELKSASGDAAKMTAVLAKYKVKFESTGEFSVETASIPKIEQSGVDAEAVWQAIARLKGTGDMAVERSGENALVLRLKKRNLAAVNLASTATSLDDQFSFMAAFGPGSQVMRAWLGEQKTLLKVDRPGQSAQPQ